MVSILGHPLVSYRETLSVFALIVELFLNVFLYVVDIALLLHVKTHLLIAAFSNLLPSIEVKVSYVTVFLALVFDTLTVKRQVCLFNALFLVDLFLHAG